MHHSIIFFFSNPSQPPYEMHPTFRLLLSSTSKPLPPHTLTITLFTRPTCPLCTTAKHVLAQTWEKRHFEYREVNIMDPGNALGGAEYEFDVPVIHIQPTKSVSEKTSGVVEGMRWRKLMHRFGVEEVLRGMREVEGE
ncbi:hypothetical protein EV426DRAFT_595467 [Tirmania nivea]|nr:hypothetical protein EV426DRAFT_595467 [Tirmania nivea]